VIGAGDGVYYIVLKGDSNADFVPTYLDAVNEMVQFETQRWGGQEFSSEIRRECLDAAAYMEGTLDALLSENPNVKEKADEISDSLRAYRALFYISGLDSDNFNIYWPIFQEWDRTHGPAQTSGYPASLTNYYQLTETADEIQTMAKAWLDLDLPVTVQIAQRIVALGIVNPSDNSLQTIWDDVTKLYSVDFGQYLNTVMNACNHFGQEYIIAFTEDDDVRFDETPDYLVNLVTGGEDFAINYLLPESAFSQLYLTASKNTSLLTMINIFVHEASHGFNFVMSAKNTGSPLLNLNTALEVPMTEGMAFYREFQYWAAAQELLGQTDLNDVQKAYMELYGQTNEDQAQGILCAQLETYIWRVIRYIRALCDVNVNGGKMTYTDFISWAADYTGLSEETLHGECFTLLSAPGYAPCYAVGMAAYSSLQKRGIENGKPEIDFNTYASRQGFYSWPIGKRLLGEFISKD
jgi:hypothetical protein